jgi:hypothetical protein
MALMVEITPDDSYARLVKKLRLNLDRISKYQTGPDMRAFISDVISDELEERISKIEEELGI